MEPSTRLWLPALAALLGWLADAENATAPPINATAEDRQYMDKDANVALARMGMNTLTTTCGGACGAGVTCVIVGRSSANQIDCLTDPRCVTLKSGQTAWCMLSFESNSTIWTLSPARSNETVGSGPFDRISQLQLAPSVTDLIIRRASNNLGPLTTPLDISSLSLQTTGVLASLVIDGLEIVGAGDALTLNKVLHLSITRCKLTTIPVQLTMGNLVQSLDLSGNEIATADTVKSVIYPSIEVLNLQDNRLRSMNITPVSLPFINKLLLDRNNLSTIPDYIFGLSTLTTLNLSGNPIDASQLTDTQFAFLAELDSFSIDGFVNSSTCPSPDVVSKLSGYFKFCVNGDGHMSSSSSTSGDSSLHSNLVDDGDDTSKPSATRSSSNKLTQVAAIIGVTAVVAFTAWAVFKCLRSLCCPTLLDRPMGDSSEPLVEGTDESGTPPLEPSSADTSTRAHAQPKPDQPNDPAQAHDPRVQGAISLIGDDELDEEHKPGPFLL